MKRTPEDLRERAKEHAAKAVQLARCGEARAARAEVLRAYRLHEDSLRLAASLLRRRREVLERLVINEKKSAN